MLFVGIISSLLFIYCLMIKIGHHTVSFNRYLAMIAAFLWIVSILDIFHICFIPFIFKLGINVLLLHGVVFVYYLYRFSKSRTELQQDIDLIFVFGAGLIENRITLSLKQRLNKTIEIANKYPHCPIIVSGGQGKNEWLSEAEAMKNYLVKNEIDVNRILMEDKSTSTQENLVYSMKLYDMKNKKIVLISNQFHVYRIEKMALKLGLDGISLAAYMTNIGTLAFYIREYLACVKAFIKREI